MRAQILLENETSRPDLVAENGLSVWLESGSSRIVFDTGPSEVAIRNAREMGIEVAAADIIVVSHGHNDHAGGLAPFAQIAGGAAIYVGENFTNPRYKRTDDGLKTIGLDVRTVNAVSHRLRIAQDGQSLVPGVTALTAFPSEYPRPASNRDLLVGGLDGIRPDLFADELALLIDTKSGPVLVTGCSHRGIANIVIKARERAGRLAAVIGGFHLRDDSPEEIRRVCECLAGTDRVLAGHCTGAASIDVLRSELGAAVERIRTGSIIEIP